MMLHHALESHVAPRGEATFHDLMASVGYLLFQWGLLETSLDEEIAHLRRASGDKVGMPGRARSINERLAEWRALLGRGRRRRADHHAAIEGLATRIQEFHRRHALLAAGFVNMPTDDGPAIRSAAAARQGAADDGRMTLGDMLETIEAMDLCRSEMALLRGLSEH